MPAKIFERLDLDRTRRRGIGNDDIGGLVLDRGLELRPTRDRSERMLRTEDDSEVRKEMTWKECDDVHSGSGSVS